MRPFGRSSRHRMRSCTTASWRIPRWPGPRQRHGRRFFGLGRGSSPHSFSRRAYRSRRCGSLRFGGSRYAAVRRTRGLTCEMSIYNLYMTIYNRRSENRPALPRNETTAQILALLSGIAGNELHTNEIIRRVNGNPRAVQRALVNSEAGGLITSRRIGNLRLWRMNPTNPLYESMRELFGRTRGVPAKLASVLAKSRGVRVAFLFGSYATAKDNPTSDIDLFVIGTLDWMKLAETLRSAGRQLGRVVNPIIWSEADFAEMP